MTGVPDDDYLENEGLDCDDAGSYSHSTVIDSTDTILLRFWMEQMEKKRKEKEKGAKAGQGSCLPVVCSRSAHETKDVLGPGKEAAAAAGEGSSVASVGRAAK